jgi:hypothetical protein
VPKSKKIRRIIWDLHFFRGDKERYEKASFWEKAIEREIMSLFPEEIKEHIEFSFGPGAGSGEKLESSPFDSDHPFDIEFSYDGEIFAYVEVAERYSITFDKYPTQFIQDYKVEALPEISQPVFFVYVFSQSDEYYWTTRTLAKTYPTDVTSRWVKEDRRYEDQRNYEVAKEAWRSGLESLVKEMLKGCPG